MCVRLLWDAPGDAGFGPLNVGGPIVSKVPFYRLLGGPSIEEITRTWHSPTEMRVWQPGEDCN